MEFPDFYKITVCDVPGLLDGAHQNVGLGHYFLRHIERTKLLIYVIDMAGVDGRTPWEDYEILRKELDAYMKGLSDRVMMIAANKMDLPESQANLEEFILRTDTKLPIFPLSAASDASFTEFQNKLRELKEQADLRDLEAQRRRSF
jgi:GTP-binding protein